MKLDEYKTDSGEVILYAGQPNFEKLERLAVGSGDIWHSSFEQGYKNVFPELVYQTATFFWYLNDFDNLDQCVSWRVNPNAFAVRKTVWDTLNGFDKEYKNLQIEALDFGYNAVRNSGVVSLYVNDLFTITEIEKINISARDRYTFFIKNFKLDHALFMIYRQGLWKWKEWDAFFYARKNFKKSKLKPIIKPRVLKEIEGNPKVSYIIPTMFRQDYTLQLLSDLESQSFSVTQVVVVDATPVGDRNESLYNQEKYSFELIVRWQESKGSCRARNEAIDLCTGDYVVFGDDDIRIPSSFIENHIRFLQTNKAGACNGLDIRADHQKQDLKDLEKKLNILGDKRWIAGSTQMFSNANSCVKREYVKQLVGNDVNFDGGYGEDSDFGMSLSKIGVTVLHNPFSVNLHLKPPTGGYRFWGTQAKITGKKRKSQPWELNAPVKWVKPVPSPTVMYGIVKHFTPQQVIEYKEKHFFLYLFKGTKISFLFRLIRIPYKNIQFKKSLFYAKNLLALGKRTR
jgi:glycosyltransferase involved in cell wall biosynthesis